jgi:hypothetical protein
LPSLVAHSFQHDCPLYSPWGEHEIDYVLFFCVKSKEELTITPHPDEVDAVKWVTRQQLIDMIEDPKLLLSPWFRLICKKWLLDLWWMDLNTAMASNTFCDYVKIHCFDPPQGTLTYWKDFNIQYHAGVFGQQHLFTSLYNDFRTPWRWRQGRPSV